LEGAVVGFGVGATVVGELVPFHRQWPFFSF